jgi:hypothetical protein
MRKNRIPTAFKQTYLRSARLQSISDFLHEIVYNFKSRKTVDSIGENVWNGPSIGIPLATSKPWISHHFDDMRLDFDCTHVGILPANGV